MKSGAQQKEWTGCLIELRGNDLPMTGTRLDVVCPERYNLPITDEPLLLAQERFGCPGFIAERVANYQDHYTTR